MTNPSTVSAGPDFSLEITALAYGGDGVGRHGGKVVFVPGTIPGETVRVIATTEHSRFIRAGLVAVERPAVERIEPICPLAHRADANFATGRSAHWCPGCAYQHLDYSVELRWKALQLQELFARIARQKIPQGTWQEPVAATATLGYRNKLVLHAGRDLQGNPAVGYYADDNRTLLDVTRCPLAHPAINARLEELRADTTFIRRIRPGAAWTFRNTERDGAICWEGRANPEWPWLEEMTPFGPLAVPRCSFFQVNPAMAALLAETFAAAIREFATRSLIDLYCGCGLFTLTAAAAGCSELLGIDSDALAIRAANANAQRRELADVRFISAPAEQALPPRLTAMPEAALLVDPPRTGLPAEVRAAIIAHRPSPLFYISCGPDTLARDCRALLAAGYRLHRVQLFDLFPRTAHFETLAVLLRN